MRTLATMILAVTLAACGGKDDPFTADMKMICGAGGGRDDLPPEMRRVAAMREIAEKIRTPEAARLIASLVQLAPADQPSALAPALAKAGLTRCAFVDGR